MVHQGRRWSGVDRRKRLSYLVGAEHGAGVDADGGKRGDQGRGHDEERWHREHREAGRLYLGAEAVRDFFSLVGAAVQYDDDLHLLWIALSGNPNGLQAGAQEALFVAGWDDDGKAG